MLLAVDVEPANGGVVLHVRGEIDAYTSPILIGAIEPHYGPDRSILIDLSEVTFCDSSGLVVLVNATRKQAEQRGVLWLRNPAQIVRRVLDVTGLNHLIEPE